MATQFCKGSITWAQGSSGSATPIRCYNANIPGESAELIDDTALDDVNKVFAVSDFTEFSEIKLTIPYDLRTNFTVGANGTLTVTPFPSTSASFGCVVQNDGDVPLTRGGKLVCDITLKPISKGT